MNATTNSKLVIDHARQVLDIQWCIEDHTGLPDEETINGWFQLFLDELSLDHLYIDELYIDELCTNKQNMDAVEVCLRIVNDQEIADLNLQYRGKAGVTNVLSFPNDVVDEAGRILLGDIVICSDVVIAEATRQIKSVEAHFAHLLIHGLLHLQGHDHSEDDQALIMEALEIKLMDSLGFSDPYE